ncbi:MAG TPA: N-acetyltransferase [Dietzia timorensis]|uniref:N-acetyltransferase n=1 Tax=Dietzia timorensis TaxID=499555 RepID=A0A921F557_9ACTN|nr:N-acetyltransferase [Dietzia timorensis]HJE91063.1 N-acetyltransferase [Dietzia timorensis]
MTYAGDKRDEITIRAERRGDEGAIDAVTREAFAGAEYSDGTEQDVVAALRGTGALTVSLVAESGGEIIGHVAASAVRLDPPAAGEWYGIGPLSVRPDMQKQGVGAALMKAVLERLGELGAAGVVLLGDPEYYRRFGFVLAAPLRFRGAPAEYFQAMFLGTGEEIGPEFPASDVIYDDAFGVDSEA